MTMTMFCVATFPAKSKSAFVLFMPNDGERPIMFNEGQRPIMFIEGQRPTKNKNKVNGILEILSREGKPVSLDDLDAETEYRLDQCLREDPIDAAKELIDLHKACRSRACSQFVSQRHDRVYRLDAIAFVKKQFSKVKPKSKAAFCREYVPIVKEKFSKVMVNERTMRDVWLKGVEPYS